MRRAAAVLGALALVLAAAAPAGAAKRSIPRGFYGAIYGGDVENAPSPAQDATWNRMAEAGVESMRVTFNWNQIEPQRGSYDWTKPDFFVAAAATHGMSLMPTVLYAPPWARRYASSDPSPPVGTKNYAAFMDQLVRRYGPSGSFWQQRPELPKLPVRYWQVWNEPELTSFWLHTEKSFFPNEAKLYGALARAAYGAIHAADPGAKVVLAGLTNSSWDTLAKLYKHAGIRKGFDIAAINMFPGNWRNVTVVVKRFRAVLDRAGDRKKPIWVTELAWPAAKGRVKPPPFFDTPYYRGLVTTEQGSAERLAGAYGLLGSRSFRTANRLERVHWFSAATYYRGDSIWDYVGLLAVNGSSVSAKPQYAAFQKSARGRQGCSKDARGSCR